MIFSDKKNHMEVVCNQSYKRIAKKLQPMTTH